jgi:hypothetical protein
LSDHNGFYVLNDMGIEENGRGNEPNFHWDRHMPLGARRLIRQIERREIQIEGGVDSRDRALTDERIWKARIEAEEMSRRLRDEYGREMFREGHFVKED